jgi:DNA primase
MSNPVEQLLITKGLSYGHSGKDFLTKCLNPDHNDSNPSFRIDKTTGISHCFSCGYKCNIFKHFGVFANHTSIKVAKLKAKLLELMINTDGLEPLKGAKPFHSAYRGLPKSFLQSFGAFTTDHVDNLVDHICFPLTDVRGKTVAYIGRNTLSNEGQRYNNYPVGAALPLFPVLLKDKHKNLVLVEGLFDMLVCQYHGITNAVACFGTGKLYNETASKLMPYKVMGIEKIFILFDADTAGKQASEKLKPIIEECGFVVEIINLPEGEDPGSLEADHLEQILHYTK